MTRSTKQLPTKKWLTCISISNRMFNESSNGASNYPIAIHVSILVLPSTEPHLMFHQVCSAKCSFLPVEEEFICLI